MWATFVCVPKSFRYKAGRKDMVDFQQIVINWEKIMAELGYSFLEQQSSLYKQTKQVANAIYDEVKPDCEKFIAVLEGTQEVTIEGYSDTLCFPRRFLKVASTSNLPTLQRVPLEEKLEKTFSIGLVSYWFSVVFPTRNNYMNVDFNAHIPKWLRDSVVADMKLKFLAEESKQEGGGVDMVFRHLYDVEVEPVLKSVFKVGLLRRGVYRSYFRNIFYAGVLLPFSIDLATQGKYE